MPAVVGEVVIAGVEVVVVFIFVVVLVLVLEVVDVDVVVKVVLLQDTKTIDVTMRQVSTTQNVFLFIFTSSLLKDFL